MRFDPKLGLSPEAAYQIELNGFGDDPLPVLITSVYPTALALELVDGEPFVRASTGDEVTDALTTGLVEKGDDLVWPGDAPLRLAQRLSWRDRPDSQLCVEDTVRLWSGEVIFNCGHGKSGPFYVHQMAATAWAFSNALAESISEVFECQIVPYACARRFAPDLLRCGEPEIRRLRRFDVAPLRPWGSPTPISLPLRQNIPR